MLILSLIHILFNNYERMQEMESVIASAIPERVESALMGKDNAAGKDKPESHVVVEAVSYTHLDVYKRQVWCLWAR